MVTFYSDSMSRRLEKLRYTNECLIHTIRYTKECLIHTIRFVSVVYHNRYEVEVQLGSITGYL